MIELIKKRPFCLASGIFIAAVFCSYPLNAPVKLITAALSAVTALFCIIKFAKERKRGFQILICGSLTAAMLFSAVYFNLYVDSFSKLDTSIAKIEATVLERLSLTVYSSSYIIRINTLDGEDSTMKTMLETSYPLDLDTGDRFSADVTFTAIEESVNGFAKRRYEISHGIYIFCISEDESSAAYLGSSATAETALLSLRGSINGRIDALFGKNSGFVRALFTGDRSNLASDVRRDFSRVGMSHMLAISGLHLTIIVGAVMALIEKLRLGYRVRCVSGIIVCVFYMALTGFSGSVTRAGIMFIIGIGAGLLRWRSDSVTSLFAAVTLICIVHPDAFCDIGLMLSFLSVFGIITTATPLQNHLRERFSDSSFIKQLLAKILCAIAVTCAAILFTLPVIWIYFGQLSLVSPIANLLFSLPMTLVILIIPLSLVLSFIPLVSTLLITTANGVISLTLAGIGALSYLPGLMISLRYPFVDFIAAAFVTGIIIIFALRLPTVRSCAILCVSCAAAFAVCFSVYYVITYDDNTMYYVNVGKNDSIVIKSENKILICDITDGGYSSVPTDAYIASDLLYSADIDTYMLTHYHKKNISSVMKLLDGYYVRNLLLPSPDCEEDCGIYRAICELAGNAGCGVAVYERGGTISYASVNIKTSVHTTLKRSTHPVIAMSFESPKNTILYCGASSYDSAALRPWLDSCQLTCDAVIFGEHGPKLKFAPLMPGDWEILSCAVYADTNIYNVMKTAVDKDVPAYIPYKNYIAVIF
ncbi:MAG: ComEC/Rec2 family competence protein [Eubacteriales bacterium]